MGEVEIASSHLYFWRKFGVKEKTTYDYYHKWLILCAPPLGLEPKTL